MSSGLKTGLAIVLLLAAVFGVTVISQLTPSSGSGGTSSVVTSETDPPLAFSTSDLKYDPKAEGVDYQNRIFEGFLEVGTGGQGSPNWIGFVLRNLRPSEVVLSGLPPSCGKCTRARVGTLPHTAMAKYADAIAMDGFLSLGGVPNPLAGITWAQTSRELDWFIFDFDMPSRRFTVPAAPDRKHPVWVFLDLDFTVYGETPPATVTASFDVLNTKGEPLRNPCQFHVTYAGREPFEVWPKTIAAGEFPEGLSPQTFEIFVFSMTRNLTKPVDSIVTGRDPAVSIGEPVRLTASECSQLGARLTGEMKAAVRVVSAYRYPVTVRRQAEGQSPDVGDFEKSVQFASLPLSPRTWQVTLTGLVTGPVKLDGATKIDLGKYSAERKTTHTATLVTEQLATELELLPERCEPRFVKYSLGEPKVEFGLKRWPLRLTIAEQEGRSPPWKGVVVLQTKGPNPVTYRFPVEGSGLK